MLFQKTQANCWLVVRGKCCSFNGLSEKKFGVVPKGCREVNEP
jgi:hypothetical protein